MISTTPKGQVTTVLSNFALDRVGPLPVSLAALAVAIAVVGGLLRWTPFGRHVYAVGGDPEAARANGVPVTRTLIWSYVICGALAAGAGVMLAARATVGSPTAGQGLELSAITVVVIGGTSLLGGRGTLLGTLGGVVLLALIESSFTLLAAAVDVHRPDPRRGHPRGRGDLRAQERPVTAPGVLGLGESLLRLSTPGHERLEHAGRLDVHVGGAEMNALIAAAGARPAGHLGHAARRQPARPPHRDARRGARHRGGRRLGPGSASAAVLRRARRRPAAVGGALRPRRDGDARAHRRHVRLGASCWTGTPPRSRAGSPARSATAPAAAVRALLRGGEEPRRAHRLRRQPPQPPVDAGRRRRPCCAACSRASTSCSRAATISSASSTATPSEPIALARRAIGAFGHTAVVLRDSAATATGRVEVTVTAVTADAERTSSPYEAELVDAFGAGDAALGALLAACSPARTSRRRSTRPRGPARSSTRPPATPGRDARPTSSGAASRHGGCCGDRRRAATAARQRRGRDHAAPRPRPERRGRRGARRRRAHGDGGDVRPPGGGACPARARRLAARPRPARRGHGPPAGAGCRGGGRGRALLPQPPLRPGGHRGDARSRA